VEVMITLVIIGMIALMVFGVLRMGLSAWEKGESKKEEYQKNRILPQLICRQVKSAVPYRIKTPKAEGDYLAFEGKSRSLKFVSALSLRTPQPAGFVFAVYEFKEGGAEGGRLVLYEQRVLNRDFMEEGLKEETAVPLIREISDIRFEYYREENASQNRPAAWLEDWNAKEEKELPKAIRMTITPKKKDEGEPPLILMASLPSQRFEEVRVSPMRRMIPIPPGPMGR
jgi:general secretion pathway protein J